MFGDSSNLNDFDEFDEASFPEDDFDDLPDVEEEGGISRTFLIAGGVLGAAFLGLMGVIGILLLSGEDGLSQSAIDATNISGTNFAIQTQVAVSQTAISEQETAVVLTEQAGFSTQTAVAAQQSTATQVAVETSLAATQQQVDIQATATQAAVFAEQTVAAASPTPGQLSGVIVDPSAGNAPVANALVCIFLDDGDGVFNPAEDTSPLCVAQGQGGASVPAATTPAPASPTVAAPSAGSPTVAATTPADSTPSQLNPIFQTSTAAAAATAAAGQGGAATQPPAQIPSTATPASGGVPASPTPEGSGFNENFSAGVYSVGRSIDGPGNSGILAQEGGDGDEVVGQITTDAEGRFVITGLPPGQYWIKIADRTLTFNVTTEPQLITFDTGSGAPVEILIPGAVATPTPEFGTGGATATVGGVIPTDTPINPIDATNTAAVAQTLGVTIQPSATELATTGLFSGDSSEVTGSDLLILGLAGMVLVGVVMAARRMRSAA